MTVHNRPAYESGLLLDERHNPGELERRRARAFAPPVRGLNRLVEEIRAETGKSVPLFDPDSGGENAKVLILLQDPSQAASAGSGFISRHNNDRTARNTLVAADRAGLDYGLVTHWNVVPWWVADPDQPTSTLAAEVLRAQPYVRRTLALLPDLRVVVLTGKVAQGAWAKAVTAGLRVPPQVIVLSCPHPSPLAFPKMDPVTGHVNSELIVEALGAAARLAREPSTTWSTTSQKGPCPTRVGRPPPRGGR